MFEPFKFTLQATLVNKDEDTDTIIGEVQTEPVVLYGLGALQDYLDEFLAGLAELNGTP